MFNLLKDKEDKIYFLVPGFIGNYNEGFMKKLADFLVFKKNKVKKIKFKGHKLNESKLSNLDEMVLKVQRDFLNLRSKFPNIKIIVLAHSQGCVVSLKAFKCFDKKTFFVFFAPAIFIKDIILKRITNASYDLIKEGGEAECQLSRFKKKVIDLDWYNSYKNFSVKKEVQKFNHKILIVRPNDDYLHEKNIDFLKNNLKICNILETKGDHSFEKPKESFAVLADRLFKS